MGPTQRIYTVCVFGVILQLQTLTEYRLDVQRCFLISLLRRLRLISSNRISQDQGQLTDEFTATMTGWWFQPI